MNIKKVFVGIAAALGLTGCSAAPQSTSEANAGDHDSAASASAGGNVQAKQPRFNENVVTYALEKNNSAIHEKYDRALKLIQGLNERVESISTYSWRSGDWYLVSVVVKSDASDEERIIATDDGAVREEPSEYVVDMSNEIVVKSSDWQSMKPFMAQLAKRKPLKDEDDEKDFMEFACNVLAVVATGRSEHISPISGQRFPAEVDFPKVTKASGKTEMVWFVSSHGMRRSFTKHVVTWDGANVEYTSSMLSLDGEEKTWD